jgi:uncharacterized membrane protein
LANSGLGAGETPRDPATLARERGQTEPTPARVTGESGDERAGRFDSIPIRKIAWTLAGATLLLWSIDLFGYVDQFPWLSVVMVVLSLWGFGTIVASWYPRSIDGRVATVLAWTTVGLTLAAFIVWSYTQVVAAPGYGTDEVAFDQYAAQLLLHGLNPYVHSMARAFSLYHVSPNGYTFRLTGQPVTSLSYPALSFLIYVPFLAAGWSTQLAIWVNVASWALGIALAFALLPREIRALALVLGSLGIYINYAVGGVTDALFVPILIGAVYQWDRFAFTRGPAAWRGPILLGLAMSVKQTPWLVLPFLASGIALEARARGGWAVAARTTGRYLAITAGAFLLPNLWFIVANPHAWLSGILTPVASHAVPAGQGLVGLSLFLGLGGGSLATYTLTLVVVFFALWALYLATYPTLRAWAVVCPSIVLFFSARSFGSYLVTLVPVALVAACTLSPSACHAGWRRWKRVALAGVVATAASVGSIFLIAPPLGLAITTVRTTGQLATVVQVGVRVSNHSGAPVHPAFSVESGGTISAFWIRQKGPESLAAGKTAKYLLLAPNFFAQPPITGDFQVVAFTNRPGTVSVSSSFKTSILHLSLDPDAINEYQPVGKKITVKVHLLDDLNQPVHRSGVPVYMGQITYTQQGLRLSQAIINGGQPGQTPVTAFTDGAGIATFVIQGTDRSVDPVYFEANLVNGTQFFPYGYSEILPIRFGTP